MRILEHVPLAPLTTLQVGGPARYFLRCETLQEVREGLDWAKQRQLPLFVLGGGSNLVVADEGFPGLVLQVAIGGIHRRAENGKVIFDAGAGVEWDSLVAQTVDENCAGLECLSGIPGTVGGTPVQNVGAYGQEVSQTIDEVQLLDLRDGQLRSFCNEACGFAYRSSIFNTDERGQYIILRVSFALEPDGEPTIAYRDVQAFFLGKQRPSLLDVRHAVRNIRHSKAMLIVEGDEDSHSAGSFFKNPVLSRDEYEKVSQMTGGTLPSYPAPDDRFKIPAAWLVEHAGFHKGYSRGRVGISRKHALAIVNRGGATAAEIVSLKNEIQRAVLDKFGVKLLPEPVFVGFE
jgi:UDP-N-acetylmuramate dehydrogenase